MRSTLRFAPVLGFAALFLLAATTTFAADRSPELIPFELEDASGAQHDAEAFAGRPLLIVAADGAASGFTGDWSAAMRDAFASTGIDGAVRIMGLADLRSVPGFMRGKIRKSLATEVGGPLLDWRGLFAKAYGFERRHCNLLLFDADGRLLDQAAGREVDAAVVERLGRAASLSVGSAEPAPAGNTP
ncbi:MAG: hypothetical protein AAGD06_25105 [Acidobacteriota bacterium]